MIWKHFLNLLTTTSLSCEAFVFAACLTLLLVRKHTVSSAQLSRIAFSFFCWSILSGTTAVDLESHSFGWGITIFRILVAVFGFFSAERFIAEENEYRDSRKREGADDILQASIDLNYSFGERTERAKEHLVRLTQQVEGGK